MSGLGIDERTAKRLCDELLMTDDEDEVIEIMRRYGYWDDTTVWREFGDNENNYSSIGNQQSAPIPALVEKLVNSVDAVLMYECYKRGISPEGDGVPTSVPDALGQFFQVKNGNLANIGRPRWDDLSKNIGLIATGTARRPSYIVFDKGEGQTPDRMPHTLLSLGKSNKLRIPFVQGKFNMGGTGVLQFCGRHNLQLIISRRAPAVARQFNRDDASADEWGFTLVRREDPQPPRRSSMYTYFAPNQEVPRFRANEFVFPDFGHNKPKVPNLPWGTVLKMYNYQVSGFKKHHLRLDFTYRVSLMLPGLGLPIRLYECRDYEDSTNESTLLGLFVRLEQDRRNNLESGFPTYAEFSIRGETFRAHIYAFKKGAASAFRDTEGVIFSINGQTHGVIRQAFFNRCDKGYLADSLLVVVECENISGRSIEDLFMNSRDRLRSGELKELIEEKLIQIIRDHQGLRRLQEQRRREELEGRMADARPLRDMLTEIIGTSPTLVNFLNGVGEIPNPYKSRLAAEDEVFEGKKYPTYFRLITKDDSIRCPINQSVRMRFETDSANDYFGREDHPGEFRLFIDGEMTDDYFFQLWNGEGLITIKLPEAAYVGDSYYIGFRVTDDTETGPYEEAITVHVIEAIEKDKLSGESNGGSKTKGKLRLPGWLGTPAIREIREDEWHAHGFDKYSAVKVVSNGEQAYDFYVNVDNIYLRHETKRAGKGADAKLYEARFKYGIVLLGLAILKDEHDKSAGVPDDTEGQETAEERVESFTRAVAPMLVPMINHLGGLKEGDIAAMESDVD